MEEIIVNDRVIPVKSGDPAQVGCVDPELEKLLAVFVRQNKESEETSESITLYADKMDSPLTGLLSQRPSLPPAPDQVVQMILPLNFGTDTPGDDLLASIFQESVVDSRSRPGELLSSSRSRDTVRETVSPAPGLTGEEVRIHPVWVRDNYPEIYRDWSQMSSDPLYQGAVRMFCSLCRENPSQGFLDGLPVCEACRVGRPCSVCRIRVTSTFSYGLALCEADRLFLYRTFSQQPQMEPCQSACPVTVQKWCGYCRFRTCLTTKGFRFFTAASTQHLIDKTRAPDRKRKYSGKGVYKELNFVSDSITTDSFGTSSQPLQAVVDDSPAPSTLATGPFYYDGSSLGLSNRKKSPGLLNDPSKVAWVMQQQEKFLKHHMDLYNKRRYQSGQCRPLAPSSRPSLGSA